MKVVVVVVVVIAAVALRLVHVVVFAALVTAALIVETDVGNALNFASVVSREVRHCQGRGGEQVCEGIISLSQKNVRNGEW